jgi:hypothetical protein
MEVNMSIFRCDECGCIENTATSNYWLRPVDKNENKFTGPALCSECDPKIGKWHGRFEKKSADGMVLATDGFLYSKEYVEHESFKWRMKNQNLGIVGVIGSI